MAAQAQHEHPVISLVIDARHTAHPAELTEDNLFHRTSISGTFSSRNRTNVSTTSPLPDIAALKLDTRECRLSLHETLSRGALGSVHRASFEGSHDVASPSALTSIPVPVVIKLVIGYDKLILLRHEAIIYQYVKCLQGSVLPRNYGYYENEKRTAAFLILEDCGMPYGQSFKALSDGAKLKLMQGLKKLHDAGIEHGDLQPWNVLNHQGSPRIVDWHLSMVHECPAKDQVMTEEFCCREGICELTCEELVSVGERMVFRSQDQILYG